MTVDIVIVTHESAEHLGRAMADLPEWARVIVVDNASTDDTVVEAQSAEVEVVRGAVNAGFAAAANRGAAMGDGELILFLNPDAHIDADTLAALVARLEDDPDVAVISPRLHYPDGTRQRVRWPFPSARGAWREAFGLHRLVGEPCDEGFVIGACFLVRRVAFEALGGFDPRYWLYGEEADLCRRAIDAGWRVAFAEDLVAAHIGGASGRGQAALVAEHFARGGEHFVAHHEGSRSLVSYRLANLIGAALRSWLPGAQERRHLHRQRARRLLRVLGSDPTGVPLDSPATGAPGVGLVVCSLEQWNEVWRRNQFMVRELLLRDPDRRVLFVEPPYDWLLELRHRPGRIRERGLRPLDGDGRIVRFEPGKVWPRLLGGRADRSLRRQVRRAARELGLARPVLWVNDPVYAGMASEAGWGALYDITDDWTVAGDGGRFTSRIEACEERLFDECAAVVVCSEGLAETRRTRRPDLVVVPNAVDEGHFRQPRPRPADLPSGVVCLYVGTLHEDRLDVALVRDLARSEPDVAVVLIGPNSLSQTSRNALAGLPNVHLLGSRPYGEVPGYLQHADVVVVPHVVSPFTESLDPIKGYECLAVGRPTVSTPVAGFRDVGGPVRCVPRADFVGTVSALVRAAPLPSEPRSVPTWHERAALFDIEIHRAAVTVTRTRVVVVDHCAQLSGGEIALLRIVPSLIGDGVDVHVILGEHGPLVDRLRDAGATVEILPLADEVATTRRGDVRVRSNSWRRSAATVKDVVALSGRLRELAPDLVHTNSLKAAFYGGAAARMAGVPVVWHIRDRIAPDYLPGAAVALVRSAALVLPDEIIVNSRATRDTLGRSIVRSAAVTVIHDAAPSEVFRPVDADHRGFRVAMVGRLARWKGQDVFLRAFADALADADAHALVVGSAMFGEDAFETELAGLVDQLGIGEKVEFTGFVDDVPRLLADVDCLVHASVIPEPFGQVVIEGMAAGSAVIASAEGGPAEIITHGVDGLLSPPGDVGALSAHLRDLASNPDRRMQLGAAARLRVSGYLPGAVAGQVRRVYERTLSSHIRRRQRQKRLNPATESR